jgi:hypothetical protein
MRMDQCHPVEPGARRTTFRKPRATQLAQLCSEAVDGKTRLLRCLTTRLARWRSELTHHWESLPSDHFGDESGAAVFWVETISYAVLPATGEDDLVRIDLQFGVQQPPAGIDYYLKRSAGVLQVWTGPTKPGNGLFGNNVNEVKVNFGQGGTATLWVEWIGDQQQPVNAVLTFEARNANGQVVGQSDSLTFYRFQTTVIVIGGFTQNPDPMMNQRGNGLFNIARQRLYAEDGYDVHLFGENEQRRGDQAGTGRAYDWALRAVNRHNINNLVVMGFSYGGGATRNLLARIDQDLANPQNPFQRHFVVPFTAYVDAIEHGSRPPRAETNLPRLTQFHVNYYQQIDVRFIRGAPVPGSNVNRDVNVPQINPDQRLDHGAIDDDRFVQNDLLGHFRRQVNQR